MENTCQNLQSEKQEVVTKKLEQELTEAYVTNSELQSENKSFKRKTYYCETKIETSSNVVVFGHIMPLRNNMSIVMGHFVQLLFDLYFFRL